jgi:hypothetical protein
MLQYRLLVGNFGVAFYGWKQEILNLPVLQGWSVVRFLLWCDCLLSKKIMDFKAPVLWGWHYNIRKIQHLRYRTTHLCGCSDAPQSQ